MVVIMKMKNVIKEKFNLNKIKAAALGREPGIDGILVTVGLCIIALLLCVVMKDSLATFIQAIVTNLQEKANSILTGV